MVSLSSNFNFKTVGTAIATTAIAWEYNIPLLSLRSLILTLGGQLAVHYCVNFVQNTIARAAEASNLIKFFNKIPLEKPTLTGGQEEQVAQIHNWMQTHAEALSRISSLDLHSQGLTAVPQKIRYFTSLRELNLNDNRITSLANVTLPASLQVLNVDCNKITSLANVTFPASLQVLNVDSNKITSLANVIFPASLQKLNLGINEITGLDNVTFPGTLGELDLDWNEITSLANVTFPASLQKLNLAINKITRLDNVTFPASLQRLDLESNRIISLANVTLPASLQKLYLKLNRITSLANVTLPASLQGLDLEHNRLTNIDPVLNLSFTCEVDAQHNRFSPEYVASFQQALSVRRLSNQGPRVTLSIVDDPLADDPMLPTSQTSVSLSDQLNVWAHEISELSNGLQTNQFASLETSLSAEEKTNLANYLRRLREIKDYRNGSVEAKQNITARVARMLDLAAQNSEFRGKLLAAISQGLETCGDRVLIIFNDIEILTQMYQEMDDSKAAKLAIRAQRYEELKKYAQNKARELGLGDEIETILYFHLKLRTTLDLPITTEGMLYPNCSGVNQDMLNEAEVAMKRIPQEELLGKSDFWQSRMKKYDKAIAAINDEYAELLDNAEEYDKKSATERQQFLAAHKKFAEMLEKYEEPFVYNKVADAIGKARGIAIANVWKRASVESQHSSTSLGTASTSSASTASFRSV